MRFCGLIKYMIVKIFRTVAFLLIVGISLHSHAECKPGQLCKIFERVLEKTGGPFAGVTGSGPSLSNLQFQQKTICEMPGAKCTDEMRLGCSKISNSVIPGVVECWGDNHKNFRLVERGTGASVTHKAYDVVANLENNNTEHKLIVARSSYYDGAVLLNENGQVLADGDALGCDSFQAAGEGTIACVRGSKKFLLKIEDLEKARQASASLKDLGDKISVNLCSIALNDIAKDRKKSNFVSRIFMGKTKTFQGLGSKSIEIITNDQGPKDGGPSCSMEPETDKRCQEIYLTKKGLECHSYGTVEYVKSLKISSEELGIAAKKYVFQNREIVPMTEIFDMAQTRPTFIKILRPDNLIGTTSFITRATGGRGYVRGTN